MTITRYRKRPVKVDTIQWTGTNEADVQAFTGREHFYALDDTDRENSDDPEATATVYDKLHSTWVLVYTGQHIIRGVKGEYYPIAEDVLAETYEPVTPTEATPGATGYCPACGRGDLAPTAEAYEQQRERAEQAEAAITRVRALAEQWQTAMRPGEQHPAAHAVLAALDEPVPAATEATEPAPTTRVIDLYEQWAKASTTLGVITDSTALYRWWEARLVELHDAIVPPAEQPKVDDASPAAANLVHPEPKPQASEPRRVDEERALAEPSRPAATEATEPALLAGVRDLSIPEAPKAPVCGCTYGDRCPNCRD